MDTTQIENIVIIGGGPAGLSAAVYNARAGLNPLVFAGSPPGGQLMLTTEVENFPGYHDIMGPDLVLKIREQAIKFGTRVIDSNILSVDFSQKPFKLTYGDNNVVQSHSVIIATGAQAIWLGLESEAKLRGRGVSACATCDGFFFRNKTVAIVGGGDTAMEEAMTLTKFAQKIYVIHRRDTFRASKIMQDRVLNHPKIEVIWNAQVTEVLGEQKVTGVSLSIEKDSKKTTQELPVDGLFLAIGHKPDTALFQNHIELDEKGYILTFNQLAEQYLRGTIPLSEEKVKEIRENHEHYSTSTSVLGVFAAGDCVDHTYCQASTAAGMGVAASLDAERYLIERE